MSHSRKVFYTNLIDDSSAYQGRLLRTFKKLLMRTPELAFPGCLHKLTLANDINNIFVHKITGICADIHARRQCG